jgi:2,4-dichlorophenol 6-monooxygenase
MGDDACDRGRVVSAFDDGMTTTASPDGLTVETDVLVVGSGPAGSSAALALSTEGVPNILITRYR